MRDLPMPGSPEISRTRPFPALALSHPPTMRSVSCSRPTSGVFAERSALKAVDDFARFDDPPGFHRHREALERLCVDGRALEKFADETTRLAADDDRVRLGVGLKPRSEVGRFADHVMVVRRARGDQVADEDKTARDADPGLQRLAHVVAKLRPTDSTSASPALTARSAASSLACG